MVSSALFRNHTHPAADLTDLSRLQPNVQELDVRVEHLDEDEFDGVDHRLREQNMNRDGHGENAHGLLCGKRKE